MGEIDHFVPTHSHTDDLSGGLLTIGISTIFIVDATGAGTISGKTYAAGTSPSNKVLTAFNSDNDSVTIHVEVDAGPLGGVGQGWQPVVTIHGGTSPVVVTNLTPIVSNTRRFSGSATINATTSGTIYATSDDDGQSQNVTYTRALDPPLVLTAAFNTHPSSTGGDPNVQGAQVATTSVTGTQTLRITGTTEAHATRVWVKSAGVSSSLQGPFTVTAGAFDLTINVRSSGNTGAQTATLYADTGPSTTAGPDFNTTNTVTISHTVPTFGSFSVSYPVTQEAIKDSETCAVTLAHTNAASGDTYLYTAVNITIPSTTTYASPKTGVTRGTETYKESGANNFTLTVTRAEQNGATGSSGGVVRVAHTTPVITVGRNSGGSALFRMGSGSGSANTTVYLISNQVTHSTYGVSLTADAGDSSAWAGSWSRDSGGLFYTRNKTIADGDIKTGGQASNNYTWGACSVKNRANREAVTVTTNPTYQLGGFTTRTLNMGPITGGDPPYTHTADIGVPVVDTSKCTVANTSKGGSPALTYEGSVVEHNDSDSSLNNYWTTVAGLASESFDDYTRYFHCSDKKFYDSVTAPGGFNCTIAESA